MTRVEAVELGRKGVENDLAAVVPDVLGEKDLTVPGCRLTRRRKRGR
jgi:hypothetical protein